ncbi:hypothetical protein FLP41_03395 (plasmid) [Paracoccus marcusii]|uniref:hypothetical protein n=1 Tax=Paracoccus marcusii TaxID=59779 RepID=UPI002ED30711|nr:hypothetical protein FLP41_03395 [Paracoccus marcusii]
MGLETVGKDDWWLDSVRSGRNPLRGSLLTDLAAMMLAMPIALFPALNEARFGGTPKRWASFCQLWPLVVSQPLCCQGPLRPIPAKARFNLARL